MPDLLYGSDIDHESDKVLECHGHHSSQDSSSKKDEAAGNRPFTRQSSTEAVNRVPRRGRRGGGFRKGGLDLSGIARNEGGVGAAALAVEVLRRELDRERS